MTILFSCQFGFLAYYLQCWHKNAHAKVLCAFGGHFGNLMQCYSMTLKKYYLAYLNLHLAVYLCYKMINVRAIIKRKSVLSHT